jgi:hypothetical protein
MNCTTTVEAITARIWRIGWPLNERYCPKKNAVPDGKETRNSSTSSFLFSPRVRSGSDSSSYRHPRGWWQESIFKKNSPRFPPPCLCVEVLRREDVGMTEKGVGITVGRILKRGGEGKDAETLK